MRRALLSEWPALTDEFGLHPWDVGGARELTVNELDVYVRTLLERRRRREQEAREQQMSR